jgi:replicative DNA helicase
MKLQGLADQLPFDLEAEKCVLGSLLRDPRRAAEISAKLKPDDFYAPRHRGLFGIMVGMETRSSGSCDPVTVAQEVDRLGREEELGGRPYLREAMEAVPSVAYLENHIRIVRDLAIRRELLNAAEEITRSIAAIDEEDVNILVDQAEQKIFAVGDRLVGGQLISAKELVEQNIDRILSQDGTNRGLRTGFLDLDEKQGFQPGDLVVLAARPSMGKTSFALNVLERVALESGKAVLLFSLEMPADQLIQRLLSSHGRIRHDLLRSGRLDSGMRQRVTLSAGQLGNARIFIDDSSSPSLAEIRAKSRRLKRDGNLDLIVVDYLQLLTTKAESRQQEISTISRTLKAIAKDLQVPVLALSQLNRAAEKRDSHRPMLSDLRESGAIEQDADMVMMLFREDYYGETEENAGLSELILAKNRNGATGVVHLRFTKECMRFENAVQVPAL